MERTAFRGEPRHELKLLRGRVAELEQELLELRQTRGRASEADEVGDYTRTLAEHIEHVLYLYDVIQSRVLYVSPAYDKLWERPRTALYKNAQAWRDGLHPDDRDRVVEEFTQMVGDASDFNAISEYRICRPDGSQRWVRRRGFQLRDEHGRLSQIAAVISDISKEKQNEELLLKLNTDLQAKVDERTEEIAAINQKLRDEIAERERAQKMIVSIVEATASHTGDAFFGSFARCLAQTVGCRYVLVCENLDSPATRVRTLAFWAGDRQIDNIEYDVAGGPCELTTSGEWVFYGEGIQQKFPLDEDLVTMQADSYCGIPLVDKEGLVIGHLAILDDRPMNVNLCETPALGAFIARAAAEMERRKTEQALSDSEARSRTLVEHAPEAIVLFDIGERRFVAANGNAATLLKRSRASLLQGCATDVSPEFQPNGRASADLFEEHVALTLAGENPTFEWAFRDPEGRDILSEVRLVRLPASDRKLIRGSMIDISERKRAENLRDGQNRVLEQLARGRKLGTVLETLVHVIEQQSPGMLGSLLVLGADNCLRYAAGPSLPEEYNQAIDGFQIGPNAGACGKAAFTKNRVVVEDIQVNPICACFRELICRHGLAACWSQPILSSDESVLGVFAMYYRQPRLPTPVEIELIESAATLAGIAIEQRRNEEAVRASEQRFRLVMENVPEFVVTVDRDGAILFANRGIPEAVSAEHARGTVIFDYATEADRPRLRAALEDVFQTGRPVELETSGIGSRGSDSWYACQAAPIMSHGEVQQALLVAVDITDRRQAELELQQHREQLAHVSRLSTMGEMATGIAHELNQPLTSIANFAFAAEQLLAVDVAIDVGKLRGTLQSLSEQSLRAGEIVRRLRAFVKRAGPRRHEALLEKLVREAVQLLDAELRLGAIDVQLNLCNSDILVHVEVIQIQQVVVNLLRNAMDAIEQDQPAERRVSVDITRTGPNEVAVRVSNTGHGVSPEDASRIFDAFFTTKDDGMGLGLAISRSIIEDHGGSLRFEGNKEEAVTFRFTLPVDKQEILADDQ